MKGSSSFAPVAARRLEGKVAFITGGASGIGEATARLFVHHGAKVIIADIQDDLGRSICDDIPAITYVHCDVSSETDVETAIDTAIAKHGKLDIAFSNAGISGNVDRSSILSLDTKDLKRVFEVNAYGAFHVAKHAAKVMIPQKKGSIIFTSSVATVTHGEAPHAYAASKHAVVGLTKNLCVEMGKHGIRVNCISPYAVATPLLLRGMRMEKESVERVFSEGGNLKGAVLSEEDVAEAAMFLGSDESKYVSGLNLVLDGGYSTTNASAALTTYNAQPNTTVTHGEAPHAYAASKHAVVGLTKNLCVEMGKHGIRVNCISPYAVATPLLLRGMRMEKESVERVFSEGGNLKGAVLSEEDVAEAAMFLGSDESKYVSGLNLVLDGGYSTTNASAALTTYNAQPIRHN